MMEPENSSPEKKQGFSGPLLFYVILGIIVGGIALFLILRPS
jgi:hypothetical protein